MQTKTLTIPGELHLDLTLAAEMFDLDSPDQLAQMALRAVIDLIQEDEWLHLPMMFQQVPLN